MGAFIGYGDVGVWTSNRERDAFLDWFADNRCKPGDVRWEFCKSDGNRWSGCGIELAQLIPQGQEFIIAAEEFEQASIMYSPHVAQILVIIDAITRGEWKLNVGSKDADRWRRPEDRDLWARDAFRKETNDLYLDRLGQSPFPGMDPFLWQFWPEVRLALAVYSADLLNQSLPRNLVARIDRRTEWEQPGRKLPGEPIARPHIDIRDIEAENRIITVIDFVDPSAICIQIKYDELEHAGASLVDIDLHVSGFRAVARRGWDWRQPEVRPFSIRRSLPAIPIPLRQADEDLNLRLQFLVDRCYRMGRYFDTIDYQRDLYPPMNRDDSNWIDGLLREAGKRK